MVTRGMVVLLGVLSLVTATSVAADAVCEANAIQLLTPGSIFDRAIPVMWRIDQACDLIETSVSVYDAAGKLVANGTPIYGGRDLYSEEFPVPDTGLYWLAAYAIDEQGRVAETPLTGVLVVVPSTPITDWNPFSDPGLAVLDSVAPTRGLAIATHTGEAVDGTLYTGTDADFLQPMGDVHFAALKSEHSVARDEGQEFHGGGWVTVISEGGTIASSTDPVEVAGQFDAPLVVGDESFAWDPLAVQSALDQDSNYFEQWGFPRSGLYGVFCSGRTVTIFVNGVPLQSGKSQVCGASPSGVMIGFAEGSFASPYSTGSGSQSSSLTYFIPAAPPGKKVDSAKLRAQVDAIGAFAETSDFSVFHLSGKAPSAIGPSSCSPYGCNVWVTWDFTEEASALASQGGGLLPLATRERHVGSGEKSTTANSLRVSAMMREA